MKTFSSPLASPSLPSGLKKLSLRLLWLRSRLKTSWDGRLATLLIGLSVILGGATYAALRSAPPFGNNPDVVIWLLNTDLVVLGVLGILIARRVVLLYTVWRKGIPGARLHIRLVYIFGLLAMAPAIVMTIFSLFFFHYGVQTWFSDRVKSAVTESQEVAEAYLREHHQVIRSDILAMANDLDRESTQAILNPSGFQKYVQTQSAVRGLTDVVVFNKDGRILNEAGITAFRDEDISDFAMDRANEGEVVLLTDVEDDQVKALVRLNNFADTYLYVGRNVESNVLMHLQTTREAAQKYDEMATHYLGLRTSVTLIYVVVALILLMSAIWFALVLARRLAQPITSLIEASERVRQGDLTAILPEKGDLEEFAVLNKSFNRMTRQIEDQRSELIEANRRVNERRQFTETILAGVSSGVLSIDTANRITLANASAGNILGRKVDVLMGKTLEEILPGTQEMMAQAYEKPHKLHQSEITVLVENMGRRTLLVRVAIELLGERDFGAVVTFDDITTLQAAQRKSAWADVARRIAHEIKNPLTPIQLSAERLKRRYMDNFEGKDREVFGQCIDTIIRHVDNIGRMVAEFSSFARMPEPKFTSCRVVGMVREVREFYRTAHPELEILGSKSWMDFEETKLWADEAQLRQALTNIVQNALDSVDEAQKIEPRTPRVGLWLTQDNIGNLIISVGDNGLGLPKEGNHDSLTEPYVTYKAKGTGLGLAIVKKIMEDHGGQIAFGITHDMMLCKDWQDLGGAYVSLVVPIDENRQSLN